MMQAALLLADSSPCLRLMVLRELLQRSGDDAEVGELLSLRGEDALIKGLSATQGEDGSWQSDDPSSRGGEILVTARALARLGYLGLGRDHPMVQRGAEYLFDRQRKDGAWPLPAQREQKEEHDRGYSIVPLQTALPLRGLAACGYATDPRAERAYDWLLAQLLPDGAWPTGMASGNPGYVAGYRKLAHSRWGCRSNTTGALICFALHPQRRTCTEVRRALDLLLGRETREEFTLGFEVARLVGAEPARGFFTYHARFDLALILDLCWRIGATRDDERVAELAQFVQSLRGAYGLWEYRPHPQVSRWLTFDLLRSLAHLDETGDWVSAEPRTPFRAYASKNKRY
jgi:Squalene-hopene cyclase C-terminal domain